MSTGPGPFEKVYDEHVVGIYRFIYARVGNHPDAEDLTAQVFVRAVEQLDTTREPGQIAAWLYRVAHNATADYWRAFYRLPLVGTDHVAPGWEPADANPAPNCWSMAFPSPAQPGWCGCWPPCPATRPSAIFVAT